MAQVIIDFQKFSVSKQPEQRGGGKRHADSDEYFFRTARKPARPKFLSRQERCSKKNNKLELQNLVTAIQR